MLFALKQLFLLRAIDKDAQLTDLGREMNRFPLEPSYAKVLLASNFYKCHEEMVTLVSLLSTENIWVPVGGNDEERYSKVENIRKSFAVDNSDHLTMVNVYNSWRENRYSDSWLRKNFLLFRSMRQAKKIREQLFEISDKVNYRSISDFFKSASGLENDGVVEK